MNPTAQRSSDAHEISHDEFVLEVELALWNLNTLYKLQNSFQSSVISLTDAKEQLMAQIKKACILNN